MCECVILLVSWRVVISLHSGQKNRDEYTFNTPKSHELLAALNSSIIKAVSCFTCFEVLEAPKVDSKSAPDQFVELLSC